MAFACCPKALLLAAAALLVAAALRDIAVRTVSTYVCALILALGVSVRLITGDLPGSLVAACLVFALAAACWSRAWLGGGDVKLLTAVALLVPATRVPALISATAMAGGVLSLTYLLLSRIMTPSWDVTRSRSGIARLIRIERWRITGRRSLPYACAIMAGAVITLLNG